MLSQLLTFANPFSTVPKLTASRNS